MTVSKKAAEPSLAHTIALVNYTLYNMFFFRQDITYDAVSVFLKIDL